jgi:hypothetical protein
MSRSLNLALLLAVICFAPECSRPATLPASIGDGEPGLGIIYWSTVAYAIFVDESFEKTWKPGDQWNVNYNPGRAKILASRNFDVRDWALFQSQMSYEDLFPFDEQTVFTSEGDPQSRKEFAPRETWVYSSSQDGRLSVVSHNVDALARARYGLATNQWFLGKIGTNIFYWETGKPKKIYFRTTEEKQTLNYFNLPRTDDMILGVKKAISTNNDIGFCVDHTLSWSDPRFSPFGPLSALPEFIEVSFKDAKHLKRPR